MIYAIKPANSSFFTEGSALTNCTQKLRDLVKSIKDAIIRFFQTILPCIFGKKQSVTPQKVEPQRVLVQQVQQPPAVAAVVARVLPIPQQQVQLPPVQPVIAPVVQQDQPPAQPAIAPVVQQDQPPAQPAIAPVVQQDQPPAQPAIDPGVQLDQPLEQPAIDPVPINGDFVEVDDQEVLVEEDDEKPVPLLVVGPDAAAERIRNIQAQLEKVEQARRKRVEDLPEDEVKVKDPTTMTEMVSQMWKMGTLKRNEILDQFDPPPPEAVVKGASRRGHQLAEQPHVVGTQVLAKEKAKGAICIVLEALQKFWVNIDNKEEISSHALDTLHRRGLAWYSDFADDLPEDHPVPFVDIIETFEMFQIDKEKGAASAPVDHFVSADWGSLISELQQLSRGKQRLGAVLFEGDLNENPKVYGVFIQSDNKRGSYTYYLLDLYGQKEGDPISWHKFVKLGDFNKYMPEGRYSALPFVKKQLLQMDALD